MRRWIKRGAVVAVLVLVFFATRLLFFRPDPVPVTVFLVARGRVEQTVTNSKAGTVRSRHRAKLSAEIGGRVAEVTVKKGDHVKAGAVLIRLDNTQYRAQVELAVRGHEAAHGSEKEACLSAQLTERDLARIEGLAREKLVSDQALDQARSQRDMTGTACIAARARTSQLASQVEVAQAESAKTVLRAPFDGVVAELTAERGEWITPSPPGIPMPAVLDLIDPAAIYVSAPLDEVDLGKVTVGQTVRITMDSFPGRSYSGRVTRVAPYVLDVAEQSRTFEVEATFDDTGFAQTLRPGASADVEVILGARDGVLRVPAYALLEGKRALVLDRACPEDQSIGGRLGSFLLAKTGECLVSREVSVGLKNWEFAEIASGLSEGDRVVVSLDRAEVKQGARAKQAAVAEK